MSLVGTVAAIYFPGSGYCISYKHFKDHKADFFSSLKPNLVTVLSFWNAGFSVRPSVFAWVALGWYENLDSRARQAEFLLGVSD